MTLRSLLVLALVSTASCFSLQQPALVRGAAAAPLRPARSLRMQEEAPKEAAPTPVDFTPSPPAEEEEKKGFDPTQYSITISIGVLFLVIKALSYSGILDFDD